MSQSSSRTEIHHGAPWSLLITFAILAATVPGCAAPAVSPASTPAPPTIAAVPISPAPTRRAKTQRQPVKDGPVLLREDIQLRKVVEVGGGNIKLARDPKDGTLYYLHPTNGIFRVDLQGQSTPVIAATDIFTDGAPAGMTIGPDRTIYVVINKSGGRKLTQAVIRKGMLDAAGKWSWETLASTEPYALSGTNFDHLYNGIVVSPDGKYVYVNAGSRTDHGEVQPNGRTFPDTREIPLTSAILRIPADAHDLTLSNDENALKPYLYADGTRNAYDPEFAPNGDLFAGDNGPDADFPDELDWIREGKHYGFPWRFGNQDNPQQFPNYDASKDVFLQKGFAAVENGTYQNDPKFPKPPAVTFADPVVNLGPDATKYRGDDGKEHDAAAEGKPLYTFTPHRSPLGLVFTPNAKMPDDLRGDDRALSAFILSFGAAAGTLSDKGQDLLHLTLTKRADNYEAVTTQIASGFKSPIDTVMVENRLYVLEFGENGAIWELTFQ